MPDNRYLEFESLSRQLKFINCKQLIQRFPVIFPDWEIVETTKTENPPIITLKRLNKSRYQLTVEWSNEPFIYQDEVDAICGLIAKLIRATVINNTDMLCLHCAAAQFGNSLVIFPSKFKAGKSVLSTCLAASGVTLFADDVLPISLSSEHGIAPGLAPRLRIPYPNNLDQHTVDFIESNIAIKGSRYMYLDLNNKALAKRNLQAPIGAFVLLERDEGATASLDKASESEVLRQVVWQNFARDVDAAEILSHLTQIVKRAQLYRLQYDKAEDAVKLLLEKFANQQEIEGKSTHNSGLLMDNTVIQVDVPENSYIRKSGISEVTINNEIFLADAKGATIHHLNSVGSAIWSLLVEPISLEQITSLLQQAFPDVTRKQIETDVKTLVKSLNSKNLLIRGPTRVTNTST
ncbi:MAG: PqqD family peptide modification chaperone [Gammaproteobacteria bacterium]|nr:PqqD family peptide modification chaperone [Gammaproteobacteria bacterium]